MTSTQVSCRTTTDRPDYPQAIARLLNCWLRPQGIIAKVALRSGTLRVLLEAEEIPAAEALSPLIYQKIRKLSLPDCCAVQVFGRCKGSSSPAWSQVHLLPVQNPEFFFKPDLEDSLSPMLPPVPTARPESAPPIALAHFSEAARWSDRSYIVNFCEQLNQRLGNADRTFAVSSFDRKLKIMIRTDRISQPDCFMNALRTQSLKPGIEQFSEVEIYQQKSRDSGQECLKRFAIDIWLSEQAWNSCRSGKI